MEMYIPVVQIYHVAAAAFGDSAEVVGEVDGGWGFVTALSA